MAIQTILDKNKPYGQIIGESHNKAAFAQNNIEFDIKGNRVTPITLAEEEAEAAEEAARKARAAAREAALDVKEELSSVIKAEAAEAAKKEAPKEPNPDMPDFTNWIKKDMINLARNKFKVAINPQKTHSAIRAQLEGLYS